MKNLLFAVLDKAFLKIDRSHILRTKNIRLIPGFKDRRGGKLSYAEWAHVIGIFQTFIYQALGKKTGNEILDVGCGTGLLGIESEPFVGEGGTYTGIDVMKEDIAFCKSHFTSPNYRFIHFDVANPTYAEKQSGELKPWPIADNSLDVVTALSVWTHLNERDAVFYFKEVRRVLKPGGKAIITFFLLDKDYENSIPKRHDETGRYHNTGQKGWLFNVPAYGSKNWFTVPAAAHPEDAIAVSSEGMNMLVKTSGLKLAQTYPGNWKEIPGVFFQDVLVFEK